MEQYPSDSHRNTATRDLIKSHRLSIKSGLYLPKPIADNERPRGNQQANRKKKFSRWLRRWLVIGLLAFNAYIYWRQAEIMVTQARIAGQSLDQARKANENALSGLRVTERPFVSLGNRDGDIAKLEWLKDGQPKVSLYFTNSGKSPALKFFYVANFWPELMNSESHIERFETKAGSQTSISTLSGNRDIPAEALDVEVGVPSDDFRKDFPHWDFHDPKQILGINGHYEYCDQLGGWHCQEFMIRYAWAPLFRFFVDGTRDCEDTHDTVPHGAKVLPRCEQPNEELFPERAAIQRLNPNAMPSFAPR